MAPDALTSGKNDAMETRVVSRQDSPAVSVVVPVHNASRYLSQSLDSALTQTLHDIEVICVDDGSTDDSLAILNTYAQNDKRVRVLSQRNQGAAAARNTALKNAQGQFVTFLDADDMFGSETYLETLYRGASESGCSVASGNLNTWRGKDSAQASFDDPLYGGYAFNKSGVVDYADYQFDYGFQRFLIGRDLLENPAIVFPALSFFEDPPFLAQILVKAKKFYATNEASYLYRSDYKSMQWTTDKICDLLKGAQLNLERSAENSLPKLHWYTVRHLDDVLYYVDLATDRHLDVSRIEAELSLTESLINRNLLTEIDPEDKNFTLGIRQQLLILQNGGLLAALSGSVMRRAKRQLGPLYRKVFL